MKDKNQGDIERLVDLSYGEDLFNKDFRASLRSVLSDGEEAREEMEMENEKVDELPGAVEIKDDIDAIHKFAEIIAHMVAAHGQEMGDHKVWLSHEERDKIKGRITNCLLK